MGLVAASLVVPAEKAAGQEGATPEIVSIRLGSSTGIMPEPQISPSGALAVFFEIGLAEVFYRSGSRNEEAAVSAVVVDLTDPSRQASVDLEPLPAGSATVRFSADESLIFIGSRDIREFRRFDVFDTETFSLSGETYVLESYSDALELSPVGPWYSEILFNPAARAFIVSSLETGEIVLGAGSERPPLPWFSPTNDRVILPAIEDGEKDLIDASFFDRADDSSVSLDGIIDGYPAEVMAESHSGSLFALQVRELSAPSLTELAPVTEVVFVDMATCNVRGRVPNQFIGDLDILGFSPDERFAVHRLPDDGSPFVQAQSFAVINVDTGEATVWENAPDIASSQTGQPSIFTIAQTGESFVVGFEAIRFIDWEQMSVTREILLEPPTLMGGAVATGQPVLVPERNELILPWTILDFGSGDAENGNSANPDQSEITFILQRISLADAGNPAPFLISGNQIGFDQTGQRAFVLRDSEQSIEVWNLETRLIEKSHRLDDALLQVTFDNLEEEPPPTYRVISPINRSHLQVSADGASVYVIVEERPWPEDDEGVSSRFHLYSVDAETGEQTLLHTHPGIPLEAGVSADESTFFATIGYDDPTLRTDFLAIDITTGATLATQPTNELADRERHGPIIDRGDGTAVVSVSEAVHLRDATTGQTITTVSLPTQQTPAPIISPDGSHVMSISGSMGQGDNKVLHLLTLDESEGIDGSGGFTVLDSLDSAYWVSAGFSPDEQKVFVLADTLLREYDLLTGEAVREATITAGLPDTLVPTGLAVSPDGATLWAHYTREPDQAQSFFVPITMESLDWVQFATPQSHNNTVVVPTEDGSSAHWYAIGAGVFGLAAALTAMVVWARRKTQPLHMPE
jgi:hypothetical protein